MIGPLTAESEFSRRRSLPYVVVSHDTEKRFQAVTLRLGGVLIGERLDLIKRGKVVRSHFTLPEMPK